jgi:hypothetical protein
MQPDDFLTGCAKTMELSIQGQQLLMRELFGAIRCRWRRLWRCVADANPALPRMHPPA